MSKGFSAEDYYRSQPEPSTLSDDVFSTRAFIHRHMTEGRKVVLITSGGTTVPLELNVVRYLDNFSAGTRGATSAEYFLRAGYAVIFMHRQFSLQPFSRHYSHSTNPFLDFLDVVEDISSSSSSPDVLVKSEGKDFLIQVLRARKDALSKGLLHTLTFVTVDEYLFLLRAMSEELAVLKGRAMFYLAAAVSDFYLPREKMSEHKIQSRKGSFMIEMDQVPKILKPLRQDWTPHGFIVSFKLETDDNLLISKAQQSLERYGHQVVIGNMLQSRKYEVVFISPNGREATRESKFSEEWIRLNKPGDEASHSSTILEIEEPIIAKLVDLHQEWIEKLS